MKQILILMLLIAGCIECDDPPTGCNMELSATQNSQTLLIQGCCSNNERKFEIWSRHLLCDKEQKNMCSWNCWSQEDEWIENCTGD